MNPIDYPRAGHRRKPCYSIKDKRQSQNTGTLPATPGKGRARPPVQIGRITRPKSGRFRRLGHRIS